MGDFYGIELDREIKFVTVVVLNLCNLTLIVINLTVLVLKVVLNSFHYIK